jgi:DNA-binding GntR family transcriptional regulator
MSQSPLALRIAREISQMIAVGDIRPDAHVSTQKLADHFQVSRSPVREALQLLSEQGVLEQRRNRGFFARIGEASPPATGSEDGGDAVEPADGADPYYRLAEDWLRDTIASEVTEQFLRDRYRLTKAQLMDLLNRGTNEGWIERKQGYGWRLLPVAKTPEALEQIYRFRSVIEPASLLEPTFAPDRQVLAQLRRVQESMLAQDIERLPADRLLQAGTVFHEELAKLSGNLFFHQALVRANRMRRLLEYRSMLDRARLYVQCADHLQIIDLIERGENVEASYLMRRHLSGAIARKSPIQRSFLGETIA